MRIEKVFFEKIKEKGVKGNIWVSENQSIK